MLKITDTVRDFGIIGLSNKVNIVGISMLEIIHRNWLLTFKIINLQFLLMSPYRLKHFNILNIISFPKVLIYNVLCN
jgi:hypothetical protein